MHEIKAVKLLFFAANARQPATDSSRVVLIN